MIGKIIGKYKIIRELGVGGMGAVYLAEHLTINTRVAIKALHKHLFKNHGIKQRFLREAKMQAILEHPNITKVIDFIDNKLGLFIILEYIEGEELDKYLFQTKGLMPEKEAIHYMSKILDAVGYAHSKGIIHRDLKSANIMITSNGEIKIMDFGIAKLADESMSLTKTGSRLGSPLYMSPEQVTQKKGVIIDHRADIYSLGVVFHEMLTGKPVYDQNNTSEYEIYDKIIKEPLPRLKTYYNLISEHAQIVVDKATSKDREKRFQNCLEFKQALNQNGNTPKKINTVNAKKPNYMMLFGIPGIILITLLFVSLIIRNSKLPPPLNNQNKTLLKTTTTEQRNNTNPPLDESRKDNDNTPPNNDLLIKQHQKEKIAKLYMKLIKTDSVKGLDKNDFAVFKKINKNYLSLTQSLKNLQNTDSLFKDGAIVEEELENINSLNNYYNALNYYKQKRFKRALNVLKDMPPSSEKFVFIHNLKNTLFRKIDSVEKAKIRIVEKKKRKTINNKTTDIESETNIVEDEEVEEVEQVVKIPSYLNFQMVDRAPIYPGCEGKTGISLISCSTLQINEYIKTHIDNENLKRSDLPVGNYESIIKFVINSQGKTSNISVSSPYSSIKNELKRVVKSLPYMTPALYENIPVPVHYKLSLTISIQ